MATISTSVIGKLPSGYNCVSISLSFKYMFGQKVIAP